MSLLGVVSREPFCVRAGVANGSGWGCIIQDADDRWRLSAFRGGKGAVAARRPSEGWVIFSSGSAPGPVEERSRADFLVAAIAPLGREPFARLGHSAFAYEGTIDNADALQGALDPTWAANAALRTPGDLIFAHIFSYMAGVGALYTRDVALAHASREIWRARNLGSASFIYSDGESMYAYSVGSPLVLLNLAGAIVVGSPDVVPSGPGVQSIPSGAVVSVSRRPHLGWSTTVVADE